MIERIRNSAVYTVHTVYPRYAILFSLFVTALLSLQLTPYVPIIPYASYVAFFLQLLVLLAALPSVRLRYKGASLIILIFWLCLSGWAMLSIFWSGFLKLTFQRSVLVFAPATLLFLVAHSDRRSSETFWRIAMGMSIFGTSLAAIGLIIYAFGKIDLSLSIQSLKLGPLNMVQVITAFGPMVRISSICSNPNALAAWLLITIPLTFSLFLGRKISALPFAFLSGTQAMALLLTFSRAGIMAAAIASSLLVLLSAPNGFAFAKRVFLLITASVVSGLIAYLLLFDFHINLQDRFIQDRFSISLAGRESAWSASWAYFLKKPITGVGFGVSQETILNPIGWSATAHNCYITILSEIGLVGFLLFIGLWLLTIVVLAQKILACKRQGLSRECLVLIAAASILIALMPYQIFETTILRSGFHMLFWIYLIALSTHGLPEVYNSGGLVE